MSLLNDCSHCNSLSLKIRKLILYCKKNRCWLDYEIHIISRLLILSLVSWIMSLHPQKCWSPNPWNLWICYFTLQRSFVAVIRAKYLEMERLFWIIWVGPIYSYESFKPENPPWLKRCNEGNMVREVLRRQPWRLFARLPCQNTIDWELSTTKIDFLRLWRLQVQEQGAGRFGFSWSLSLSTSLLGPHMSFLCSLTPLVSFPLLTRTPVMLD